MRPDDSLRPRSVVVAFYEPRWGQDEIDSQVVIADQMLGEVIQDLAVVGLLSRRWSPASPPPCRSSWHIPCQHSLLLYQSYDLCRDVQLTKAIKISNSTCKQLQSILDEIHLIGQFLFEAIFINSQSEIYFT